MLHISEEYSLQSQGVFVDGGMPMEMVPMLYQSEAAVQCSTQLGVFNSPDMPSQHDQLQLPSQHDQLQLPPQQEWFDWFYQQQYIHFLQQQEQQHELILQQQQREMERQCLRQVQLEQELREEWWRLKLLKEIAPLPADFLSCPTTTGAPVSVEDPLQPWLENEPMGDKYGGVAAIGSAGDVVVGNDGYVLCTVCDKQYPTVKSLRNHERKGHHLCVTCGKVLLSKKNLEEHYLLHTGERPHRCEVCSGAFVRIRDLQRHLKRFHQDVSTTASTPLPGSSECPIVLGDIESTPSVPEGQHLASLPDHTVSPGLPKDSSVPDDPVSLVLPEDSSTPYAGVPPVTVDSLTAESPMTVDSLTFESPMTVDSLTFESSMTVDSLTAESPMTIDSLTAEPTSSVTRMPIIVRLARSSRFPDHWEIIQ